MKRTVGFLILLSASSVFAQTPTTISLPQSNWVTKVVTVKYPGRIDTHVFEGIGLTIKTTANLVVLTGPPDRVDTAEAIVKQMDVPPPPPPSAEPRKNIQLTAYMVIASPAVVQGTPVPKDLDSAIAQVSSIFPYKSFNLFDAVILRMLDSGGRGHVAGALPAGPGTFAFGGNYDLSLQQAAMTSGTPNSFRLNNFALYMTVSRGIDREGKEKFQEVRIDTNIDMKEGQKIVVGKANIDGSENALIVILTAKVAD